MPETGTAEITGNASTSAENGGIPVENPATGETIATVPELGADQVRALVAAARAAQPGWAELGFEGRAEVLLAARRWMVANAERVVGTICAETGRPADETQVAELSYGLSALEFWARQAPVYLGDEEIESASPFVRGRKMVVRYAPLGVVGVIGPWNYPLNNSFGDCIPALAAGNAVVLKPSEITPLTSLLMAEMLSECGIPDGVFTVATGRGETGAALIDEVDYVMFTGSVATGKKVMAQAAQTLTPVSLELGGKDPMIVLADADLERAANAAASYGLNNSGQVCISVERIYVEEAVHDDFLAKLTEKVTALRQGPPGEPGSVDIGAIIFPPQIELIEAHVADAVDKGAEVVTGGRRGSGPGRFYEPTILTGVDHSMRCMVEETFGPTLPVMSVADAEEAVALANEGPYGLQASVWTRDEQRGEELARRLDAGTAMVNDAQLNYAALELPMGGWKDSGLGSRHGPDGIRKYTKRQSLMVDPGVRAFARRPPLPLQRAGQPGDGRGVRGAGDERPLQRRPAGDHGRVVRHVHPLARPARGRGRPARLLAPRRLARGRPRGGRGRAAAGRAAARADRGPARAARRARRGRHGCRDPARAARADRPRLLRPEPRGARRDHDPARSRGDALLRAARPRHRAQPDLGRDRLPGPDRAAARSSAASSRCTGPRAPRR